MQVNGKLLLDSAENILKNRQQESRPNRKNDPIHPAAKTAPADLSKAGIANARMLKLQSDLKVLQEDYTREQVREDFLRTKPEQVSTKTLYANTPLFPEYKQGMDMKAAQEASSHNIKRLLRNLKSIQVEIENLYALHFEKIDTKRAKLDSFDASFQTKDIDPERVSRLTRS